MGVPKARTRVLFSGGGTGGHIYPATAVAQEFLSRHQDSEILFVGSRRGMENTLVPRAGFELRTLTLTALPRKLSLELLQSSVRAGKGMLDAVSILRSFSPDLVVGTGGYVAGPVLLASAVLGYKTLIHEQNAFPSLTNRWLGRFVSRIAVSHHKAITFFPRKKVVVTGNPLRPEILSVDRELARRKLGLAPGQKVIVAVGGSGGALRINETVCDAYERMLDLGVTLFHVTGKSYYDMVVKRSKTTSHDRLRIIDYAENMPELLAASDVVVSRAGSVTSELAYLGKPCILIPSPIAANDHQTHNALVAEEAGAAILLRETQLSVDSLVKLIKDMLADPKQLEAMGERYRELSFPQATQTICDLMEGLLNKK